MPRCAIAVVGGILMDLSLQVPVFPEPGRAVHGGGFRAACGGKGANQACAAARMGARSSLIGCVGADGLGELALADLSASGVDITSVIRRPDAATGVMITATGPDGRSGIMVARGANALLGADEVTRCGDVLRQADAVVVQLETTLPAVQAALRIARDAGVAIIFNPAPRFAFPREWLGLCDYLVANEEEAGQLAGSSDRSPTSAVGVARALKACGPRNVLITLGSRGVWVDGASWSGQVPAYRVAAIDALGAGDTFAGALAVRLCEGATVHAAAQFASAAAALSTTRYGGLPSIPARGEVERMMATTTT